MSRNSAVTQRMAGQLAQQSDADGAIAFRPAEITALYRLCQEHPRDISAAMERCKSVVMAAGASADQYGYTLRRQDRTGAVKTIQGPSVRTAELMRLTFERIMISSRVISEGGDYLEAEAAVLDAQALNYEVRRVRRAIVDRNGKRYSGDMILVTGAAATAIARRNAIFAVLGRSWADDLHRLALDTVARSVAAPDNVSARPTEWDRAVRAFARLHVTADHLLGWLGRTDASGITADEIAQLRSAYQAIEQGETTVQEFIAAATAAANAEPSAEPSRPDAAPKEKE